MDKNWDQPLLDAMTERELRMMLQQARLREERDQARIHNLVRDRRLLWFSLAVVTIVTIIFAVSIMRHMQYFH